MKVFINRKIVNGSWGGGNNFVKAFFEYGREFDIEPTNILDQTIDAILIADPRPDDLGISFYEIQRFVKMKPTTKLIQRINECDARKGTDEIDKLLAYCSMHVDRTIFVSNWLQNYHEQRGWFCRVKNVIYNGVNKEHFQLRSKFDNGKVNIVTAHWSDNPLKGQDYSEWLDEFVVKNSDYTYTFIGRTKAKLKNTHYIQPMFGQQLGEEISKYDLCVNASRFDPSPNSVIEPITCCLPTYVHTDGGGGLEFAGTDHSFSSFEDLELLLLGKQFTKNAIEFMPWRDCIKKYADAIKKTCQQP